MAAELDDPEMFGVMLRKFPNIYHLRLSGNVADEKRLLKFIDKFKIRCLSFERTGLPQWFFEQLAEKGQSIIELEIKEEPTMDIRSGDLDFALKLKSLKYLSFGRNQLVPNFVARVLEELKSIAIIWFPNCVLQFKQPACEDVIKLGIANFALYTFDYEVTTKEVPELMSVLESRLDAYGYLYPENIQPLFRQRQLERETNLFMMRLFVYEQRNSIFLSRELMHLLN